MHTPETKQNYPSTSHRISLRFLPDPPTELTSTLVLNGGGTTAFFTDFRPLLSDPSRCEWAFAGVKRHLEDGRCVWDHLVDNRSVEIGKEGEEGETDVGLCRMLENGDELETGEMRNPETGAVGEYEEVWRDERVASGARVVVLRLERVDEGEQGTRGIFVMVGEWVQGVVRGSTGVCARRWRYNDGWSEVASYGDRTQITPTPTGDSLSESRLVIPDQEEYGGSNWSWVVIEDYVWIPSAPQICRVSPCVLEH